MKSDRSGNGQRTNGQQRPRIARRAVHGVLLLDKPLGLSSNDALQKVKRLFRAEKAGHTGTLDPLATGLLPLCFGAATKFSQVSLDADKRYTATLQLGVTTTTADAEGEVIETRAVQRPDGAPIERADVEAACAGFVGPISQLPPMHSALKHEGRALYDYARAGIDIEREPRQVTIFSIDVVAQHADPAAHRWVLDVHCSKGTYIRTLAEDIGKALGCGAHLAALRRTASGPLKIGDALTLEQLVDIGEHARDAALHPPDMLLADWPTLRLDAENAARFMTGVRRRVALPDTPRLRIYGPEQAAFLGSAHITAGELISDRLLSPIEVRGLLDAPENSTLADDSPAAVPCAQPAGPPLAQPGSTPDA